MFEILLEAVIKNFNFNELKLSSLQLSDDFKFTNKSRRSAENYAFDLYNNIGSLIEKDFTLNYVVKDINKLPQCIPSTIDPLSNFDRILKLESLFANFTNYNYKSIDLTTNNSINTTLDKPNDSNKSNNVTYANVVNDNSNNNNIHYKNNYIKPTSISSEGEFINVIIKNKIKYKKRKQKMYGSDLNNTSYYSSLPNRDFFISRINSDIQFDSIKDYISNKNIKIIDIKLVSNKESKFNSYKLTVDINTANTI